MPDILNTTESMTDMLDFVRSITPLSDESWNMLKAIIKITDFKKGEYLVEEGKVCHSLYFIRKGWCRAYQIRDGEEINTAFYFENEIATNINSYVTGQKSTFSIMACEPLAAYRFDKKDVEAADKFSPEIELAGKRSLEMIAARQEKQLELYRLLTARQRYEYLEKYQPHILQRVSLTQLSSYLGVARETLSRIRKKKAAK